jgi:hypothetical protein
MPKPSANPSGAERWLAVLLILACLGMLLLMPPESTVTHLVYGGF